MGIFFFFTSMRTCVRQLPCSALQEALTLGNSGCSLHSGAWLGDSGAQAHIWLWLTADILNRKRRFLFYLFIFFLDSIYRSGWPQTHSDPPTFLSTGIKGTHHHTQLRFLFLKSRGPIASQEHMPRYLLGPKLCLSLSHFQNIWGK